MPRRVAISGIGVVSPVGAHPGPFFEALLAGRTGTRALAGLDPETFPCRVAATIPDFAASSVVADAREAASLDRTTLLALAAARAAVAEAGLEASALAEAPVYIGTGFGCIETTDASMRAFHEGGARAVKTLTIPRGMANAPAAAISMRLGAKGAHRAIAAACASGTVAIGEAFRAIREGRVALALAGGAEAPVVPSVMAAWCALRVVTRRNEDPARACRPFSGDRDGLVLGEGAAVLVLEDLERARARGARVLAEVLGFGETSDAGHLTAPSLEGEVGAIARALRDAGLAPGDIDHVNAHGTATAANDRVETAALKAALGERARAIPVSATKSMTGHAIGASGAIETAATALAIAAGRIHPTVNYTTRDPDCDLDYATEGARPLAIRAALKTSFAFGGANAVLVLGRVDR